MNARHRGHPLATLLLALITAWSGAALAAGRAVTPPNPAEAAAAIDTAARIKALDHQAQAARKAKDWAKVVDLYSQAVALDATYAKGWRWRGAARSELEQHEAAIADLRKAVELEPRVAFNHNGLCWSLILANRAKEARPACEHALALEPQQLSASVNLGNTYLLEGDKTQAWRWYEQAIGLMNEEGDLIQGLLDDFNIFERKGWQVAGVREARAHFEPRAMEYLKAQAQAQALMDPIKQANEAKDRARELALRQQRLVLLSAWLAPGHPRRMVIEQAISNTQKQLGDQLAQAGRHREAIPLYQEVLKAKEALHGAKSVKEEGDLIIPLNNLAIAYRFSGAYEKALPHLQRALAIAEAVHGPSSASTSTRLNNLAGLYEDMGQYAQALPLYQRALAIAEKAYGPEHRNTGTSLNNLATLYLLIGQYAQALPLLQQAKVIREKDFGHDHPAVGDSLNNLAGLYRATGQFDQALPLYQRALTISERALGLEHPSISARLRNLAGLYMDMGQYAQALPLFQRAIAITEIAQSSDHPNNSSNLNALAVLYSSMGQYAQALPFYERALAIAEKALGPEHPRTGTLQNNLAGLYRDMGQYAQALPLYARALSIADRAGDPELSWNVYRNLMELYGWKRTGAEAASLHQPALAIWYGKQAINTLQSVRGNMQDLDKDLQKGFLEKNQKTYQTLANLLIEAGRIPEAEQVLAMLKERELGELVRSSAADAQKTQADYVGVERRASAHMAELSARGVREATELAALEKRIDNGEALSAADEARRQALITAAEVWRAEFQRFTSGLGGLFAQNARTLAESDVNINSSRLQDKVALDPAGAVGLHYVVTDEQVAIIVATPQASFGRFSPIKRSELNRQINALRQAITNKTDTRAPAQALWQALIAPAQTDIEAAGAKTLVLSLTDTLRYLPFAALQNPQGRYLVEDLALSLWAQAADVNPTASTRPWQVAGLGLTEAREGFSPLPAVRAELKGIVRTEQSPQGVLPGRIALDEQFNRAQLDQALRGQSNVLHIASHFDFKPGDESRSVLLMGQGDPISLGQLAVMNFARVEQLTLSACDTATGGGTNENGAEVEGLAAVVLKQRAKSVLATLWKVADDSTAQLMQDFYRQRAQDNPPSRAQALRAAQLALLRGPSVAQVSLEVARGGKRADAPAAGSSPPAAAAPQRPYAHPYYWAPFVLSGSWL